MRPSKWVVFIRPLLAGFHRPLTAQGVVIGVESAVDDGGNQPFPPTQKGRARWRLVSDRGGFEFFKYSYFLRGSAELLFYALSCLNGTQQALPFCPTASRRLRRPGAATPFAPAAGIAFTAFL